MPRPTCYAPLEIRTASAGPSSEYYALSTRNLGNFYHSIGYFAESEKYFRLARSAIEKSEGRNSTELWRITVFEAMLKLDQGQLAVAEDKFKSAVDFFQTRYRDDHHLAFRAFRGYASLLSRTGRSDEATKLSQRSYELSSSQFGQKHFDSIDAALFHADILSRGGDLDAAEALLRTTQLNAQGLHVHARTTLMLCNVLIQNGKASESIQQLDRLIGAEGKGTATGRNLALAHHLMGKASSQLRRWEEAQARYKLSLQLLRQLQTNDPQVRWIYLDMAEASQQQGRHQDSAMALDAAEKAHKALYSHATTSLDIVDQQGDFGTALLFASARTGWALLEANSDRAPTAARQAFQRLNYLDNGTVSTAVAQMAVRFATDNSTLGRLVRERQDLTSELLSIDRMLVSSLSGEASDISSQGRRELIERQEQLAKAVPQLEAKLKEQFPAYTELASPSPMTIAEVQSLLDEDEALVVQLVTSSETFVWGVTKNSDKWVRQNLGAAKVSEIVARLRGALDPSTAGQAAFDLSDAHKLYNELLKPLEPLIESKRHLLIVGNGALSSLPYQLLITGSPQTPVPSNVGDYASAEWLIKRHAVTTLPSVGSLRALRLFAKTQTAGKPFVGFGDPDFGSEKKVQAPEATRQVRSVASLVPAKAFRGALADVAALRESLIRLPDTANEIKSVASSVGAHEADLRLGQQATEASVKKMALGDYRIIYFATHGLVAGEAADLGGAAEPALALTVPAVATALDDGLLTASEVAGLKLNADWVVLSGCNTAAAGKPGAEALSGLARAFFYAGARSLLVSHWPVYSQAAVRLTTDTFRRLASEPGIGRAEALRLAMLDLMRDTTTPTNAYPAVWAPFSLVGEGLKRN